MKKIILFIFSIFLLIPLVSCKSEEKNLKTLSVGFPSGAPAIAQEEISYNILKGNETRFESATLNGASEIKAALLNSSYDLIYAPINLGVQIYNSNKSYKLLCGVTFGNLYFGSKETIDEVSDLNNKDIVLFGKGTINDLIATYILESNNVSTKSITYLADAAATKTQFVADTTNSVYLLADPTKSAAEVALSAKGISTSFIDIEEEYQKKTLSDIKGFAQAGLFVCTKTYEAYKEEVLNYVEALKTSISCVNDEERISTTNRKITELGYFSFSDGILKKAIKGCNISYVKGSLMKNILESTYSLNKALLGGEYPDEEFYLD